MYLAGVSVRRVEDITEALWGTKVSPGTISNLNKKVYEKIEVWRNRSLDVCSFPYVYLDGIVLKRSWAGEVTNVSLLVAIAVSDDGYREILGIVEGAREDKESWTAFLKHLRDRGLHGTQLFITDKCLGLVESIAECFPDAYWQRCVVHFYRNVLSIVPDHKKSEVAAMLKAIHAQEDLECSRKKSKEVVEKLKALKLKNAASTLSAGISETLTYMRFPREHWIRIRTNNPLERLMREIRRRTRVVGSFPDGQSALMLSAARLRHIAGSKWSSQRYLNMKLLHKMSKRKIAA
jgi:putative transposase